MTQNNPPTPAPEGGISDTERLDFIARNAMEIARDEAGEENLVGFERFDADDYRVFRVYGPKIPMGVGIQEHTSLRAAIDAAIATARGK